MAPAENTQPQPTIIGDDHRRKLSQSVSRYYEENPDARARIGQRAKENAARRRAEKAELLQLRFEVGQLRAEVARLRDGR
ncbi:hypothetical protein [Kocuria rosea]|uniref:hypothetical protein n=1 Tax=Kocuria rosea TaxID=1275 RepID=UPI00119E9C7E|nr:hypothetical protein [Kocuria rosea]